MHPLKVAATQRACFFASNVDRITVPEQIVTNICTFFKRRVSFRNEPSKSGNSRSVDMTVSQEIGLMKANFILQ